MGNDAWKAMNEQAFEAALEDSVADLPPAEIVAAVTPWKQAMHRILTGLALCTVTLNFLCLQYILPAIGVLLSLLGFRALRRENGWFRTCYLLSVIHVLWFFSSLVLNTTIYRSAILTPGVTEVLTVVSCLLQFANFLCLWRGLCTLREKAGLPPRAAGAVALMVWYGLVCVLALIGYIGLLIAAAMLVGYIFILRSLHRLSKEADEAGYSIRTAAVRVPDRWVALALALALLVGCVLGYLFGGSYPMAWQAVDPAEQAEVADIKAQLLDLGFPDYVLDDLSPEDIAACAGALRVVVDVTDECMNGGRVVTQESWRDGVRHISQYRVYDVRELRITGVGVLLPGDRETWMIFHHFLWTVDPGFYGTESIQLLPTSQHSEGWGPAGDVTGRVLYDRDGETFAAPYHSLGAQTYTADTIFWGRQTNTDVFAAFSMPAKGERHRGYVAYPTAVAREGYLIDSWIYYTHQTSWLQYPAVTATEARMYSGWESPKAFRTVRDALQFHSTKEGAELLG